MGFRVPNGNKQFLLVAKNSQMPLGISGSAGAAGSAFEQQAPINPQTGKDGRHQHFLIQNAAEQRQVYIKPGHNNLYMDIVLSNQQSSHEPGAQLIQWHWDAGAAHQRFQLVSAGNGYYRIRAKHSNFFLDVWGNTSAVGAPLMQMPYTGTENQLFKLVAVPTKGVPKDLRSFQEANEEVRNIMLKMYSGVPKVGAALGFVLGALWKKADKDQDFWNQMKDYVDERIKAFILDERLDKLAGNLRATLDNIAALREDPNPEPKGTQLQTIIIALHYPEQDFLIGADKNPLEVLPYLVAMGTIKLSLLRQRVVNYDELYGTHETAAVRADRMAFFKKALADDINLYTRAVLESRAKALAWRMGRISPPDIGSQYISQARTNYYWAKGHDDYDGWRLERKYETYTNRSGSDGDPAYKDFFGFAYNEHRKVAEVQFGAELDEYLNPARLWKHLLPDTPKPASPALLRRTVGSFGGRGGQHAIEVPAGAHVDPATGQGRLTRIAVYTGGHSFVSGLELTYGSTSTGVMGSKGVRSMEITLAEGEFVTSAFGVYLGGIDAICFETSRGQEVFGGNFASGGVQWVADLPDSFGARLVGVTGMRNNDTIERLSFEWAYEVEGTDLPRLEDVPVAVSNSDEATQPAEPLRSRPATPALAEEAAS